MDADTLKFEDVFDLEELQALQDSFAEATGVASLITRPDGTPITRPSNFCRLCSEVIRSTEQGLANCMQSDSMLGSPSKDGALILPCLSGGLWDGGTGIFLGRRHVGNWLIGQVLGEGHDTEAMLAYAREIGADEETFREALGEVTVMPLERLHAVGRALCRLAGQISRQAYQNALQRDLIQELEVAREALAASEERYALVVRGANDGIWDWDLDRDSVYYSPRYKAMLGYEDHEFDNDKSEWLSRIHPEDRAHALEANNSCRDGEVDQFEVEYRLRHRDGSWRWVLGKGASRRNEDGRPHRLGGTHTDITDRKLVEEDLANNKKLLEAVIEQSPIAMMVLTAADNVVRYQNSACRELFMLDDEPRFVGHGIWDIERTWQGYSLTGELLDDADLPSVRALGGKVTRGREVRVVRKDGAERYAAMYGTPVWGAGGELMATLAVYQDITSRKLAETELLSLRNYLASIVDSMPSVLIGTDRNLTVTQWNRAAGRWTGLPGSKALGKLLSEVNFLPGDLLREIARAVFWRERLERRRVLLQRGSERCHVDLMVFPLEEDKAGGAVLRLDDVSESVRIEHIMVQTEKMMSVGGLAAGMAHEINNPLGGILQGAQNILRRLDPDLPANQEAAGRLGLDFAAMGEYFRERSITRFLDGIQDSGRRAAGIIQNMLSFSRQSGARRAPCDLCALLDRTVELASSDYDLRRNYDFKKVDIVRRYAPDLPKIPVEEMEIEQVVLNLLKNAAQAMTEGPKADGRPRIILRALSDEGGVRLEVEDNGPGLSEEMRARIFEPFFTTKEPGVGTGLGLSVSYFIITQRHGGRIFAEPAPGGGARFVIRLPPDGGE
ncbi:PocR ligand-binding domain-containing protein [Desulfocurvus sp. DL9XJH121]